MSISDQLPTVDEAFFQPLQGLAVRSSQARPCPEFSDEDYLRCGVERVLECSASGRAFLQEHSPRLAHAPTQSNYFATLHSGRRCALLEDVNHTLLAAANQKLSDRL